MRREVECLFHYNSDLTDQMRDQASVLHIMKERDDSSGVLLRKYDVFDFFEAIRAL